MCTVGTTLLEGVREAVGHEREVGVSGGSGHKGAKAVSSGGVRSRQGRKGQGCM